MSLSERPDRRAAVAGALEPLGDRELAALVDGATPLGVGIGGGTARVEVAGVPVFVKRIALTDAAVRARLAAIAGASSSLVVFLEHLPHTLYERVGYLRRCAAGGGCPGVPAAAAFIARYAPVAVVMNDFYAALRTGSRTTPYPAETAAAALPAGCRSGPSPFV